ncbi:MAG: autotransporter outer membrane beta-barrel domain-containing protein [Sphingomonas taxi]
MMVMGTLAPGNSPGRLFVAGSVTQMAGSTFALDIDGTTLGVGAGHFDTLVLTGASSVYTAGGTIAPRVRGITGSATNTFTPTIGQTFEVVTAQGSVTGAYSAITQPTDGMPANSRFDVIYGANTVTLAVTAASYKTLLTGAATANTVNAGAAIDAVRPAATVRDGGNAGRLSRGLVGLGTAQIATVVEQAAGEIHADGIDTVLQSNRVARAAISDHLGEAASASRLWGIGIGEFGHVDGDANGRRYKTDVTGLVAGYDRGLGDTVTLGVAASYGRAKASNVVSGSSRTSSYRGAVYGRWQQDGSFVNGIVSAGTDRYHVRRTINLATGAQSQASDPNGWSWSADAEAGHRFEARNLAITPTVGMAYDRIERDALTETGDAATALSFGDAHRQALLAKAGLNVAVSVPVGGITLSPYGTASIWHELSDRNASLLATLDGAAVRTNAASLGRTAGRVGAGVNAQLSQTTALRVGYRTTILGNAIVNAVNGGLTFRW